VCTQCAVVVKKSKRQDLTLTSSCLVRRSKSEQCVLTYSRYIFQARNITLANEIMEDFISATMHMDVHSALCAEVKVNNAYSLIPVTFFKQEILR